MEHGTSRRKIKGVKLHTRSNVAQHQRGVMGHAVTTFAQFWEPIPLVHIWYLERSMQSTQPHSNHPLYYASTYAYVLKIMTSDFITSPNDACASDGQCTADKGQRLFGELVHECTCLRLKQGRVERVFSKTIEYFYIFWDQEVPESASPVVVAIAALGKHAPQFLRSNIDSMNHWGILGH